MPLKVLPWLALDWSCKMRSTCVRSRRLRRAGIYLVEVMVARDVGKVISQTERSGENFPDYQELKKALDELKKAHLLQSSCLEVSVVYPHTLFPQSF